MSIVAQLSAEDAPYAITAAVVLLAVIAGVVATYLGRVRPVNRARRAQGLPPMRWGEITSLRARTRDLAGGDAGQVTAEARRLRLQLEWEQQIASQEMLRFGRAQTRAFCAQHDRFCFKGWEGPHPPGGTDNPTVPDDWAPPGSKPVRGA